MKSSQLKLLKRRFIQANDLAKAVAPPLSNSKVLKLLGILYSENDVVIKHAKMGLESIQRNFAIVNLVLSAFFYYSRLLNLKRDLIFGHEKSHLPFLARIFYPGAIFLGEFGSAPAESCQMGYLLNHSLSRGVKLYTSTKCFSLFSLTSCSFVNRTKILCLS